MVVGSADMPIVRALSHIASPLVAVALSETVVAGAVQVVCPVAADAAAALVLADVVAVVGRVA